MTYRQAELLLAAVIIARATSFLAIMLTLGSFDTFNIMAMRFCIAFLCLVPFVFRHLKNIDKSTLRHGIILGAIFFLVIASELTALDMTENSSTVSFLENTAIVMVPVAEALIRRKKPEKSTILCSAVALAGVGILLMGNKRMELNLGIAMCICTAILYTLYIILTDRLSHKDDPLILGFITIGTVGILSFTASMLFEDPRLPQTTNEWIGVAFLAVVCGSIGTALQPAAQRRIPSEKVSLFCALSPLTACALGWLFLGEWQGPTGVIGAALILSGIILSNNKAPRDGGFVNSIKNMQFFKSKLLLRSHKSAD